MVECSLFLFDYIVNLSIFSLMVILPLVLLSSIQYKSIKYYRVWVGIYGGIVSVILVMLSIQHLGYSYDIRYAPAILVFAYFGPVSGIITGAIMLVARLVQSGNWYPAIMGWTMIMMSFTVLHFYINRFSLFKKCTVIVGTYVVMYTIIVFHFNILQDRPAFHVQYVSFVILGVILGGVLLESYGKLYRVHQQLSTMYKLLWDSEANYRLIAENTSDLIMVVRRDHTISYFSPSHQSVLGFKQSDLEKSVLCGFIHPEDVNMYKQTIEKMFNHKKSYTLEFRMKHSEGQWVEFESRCKPVVGENGQIEQIVIISRDISERKKAEELLLQSEKLSIVGELAAGVAHEIRNPLTTIKGFVQLNKVVGGSTQYNDLVLSELSRIEGITSELLSLGKPQAVQLTEKNVQELVENTIQILSPQALMNDVRFHLKGEEKPITITCEQNQIKQVFLNVLKNAIEAMKEGGDINIEIRKIGDKECLISFQDHGCGIPEELQPRLGEPFYSLKEKGTGLGLMICHKIIKQHHGSIVYKSKVQEGTTVEITIPCL